MFAKLKQKIQEETKLDFFRNVDVDDEKLLTNRSQCTQREGPYEIRKLSIEQSSDSDVTRTHRISHDDWQKKLVLLESQLAIFQSGLEEKQRMISKLTMENETLQATLNHCQDNGLDRISTNEKGLLRTIEKLKTENRNLSAELAEFTAKCVKQQDHSDEIEGLQLQQIAKLKHSKDIEELESRLNEQLDLNAKSADELRVSNLMIEKLQNRLAGVENDQRNRIVAWEKERASLSQCVEDLTAKCLTQDEELNSKNEDIGKLLRASMGLEARLEELDVSKQNASLNDSSNQCEEIQRLNKSVGELEDQLADKNKTIKLQHQRLNDMKKALQKELKFQTQFATDSGEDSSSYLSSSGEKRALNNNNNELGAGVAASGSTDDVSSLYLKNVVLKFITASEHEALHLIRAMSTLLHLTKEEEKLLKKTVDWRMSWFGSKPQLNHHS